MNRFQSQPRWWPAARQQQLVQGDAPELDAHEPAVLVIAMAMLGVLVCMVPLGAFVLLGIGEHALMGVTGMALSLSLMVAGGVLLRKAEHAFICCAALVLWVLGGVLLLINLGVDHLESRQNLLMLCALAAVLQMVGAWLTGARWIQAIMGLSWMAAVYGLLVVLQSWMVWLLPMWLGAMGIALLWLLWLRGESSRLAQPGPWWAQPRWAVFVDAAIVGLLCSMAFSGYGVPLSELLSSSLWRDGDEVDRLRWLFWLTRGLDVVAVLGATALLLRVWAQRGALTPALQSMLMLVGALLAVCAWFSPNLGVIALIAAGALLAARWRIAILCALVALSLLGHFYYLLHWPLAIKGIGVAALGAVLLLGLLAQRKTSLPAEVQPAAAGRAGKLQLGLIALGAVLVFALVNWDVRGKEQVIAHGQRILVPLVPVDPRSLMQGDYMDLRFALPAEVQEGLEAINAPVAYVSATVDAQGVASVKALADAAKTPSAGEVILPLKRLKGRWVLVTDAYFFPEGQGDHFTQGRFGDLRVLPDGRALLVGLADGQGQEIKPLPGGSIWDARPAAERLNGERRRMDLEGRNKLDMDEPSQPAPNAAAELSQEEARKAANEATQAPDVAPLVNTP